MFIKDYILVQRIKNGDTEAWETLVDQYYDTIFSYCFRHCLGNQILQLFPINWANPIKLLEILSVQDYLLGNFILNTLLLYVFLLLTVITFILASYYKIKKWSYT